MPQSAPQMTAAATFEEPAPRAADAPMPDDPANRRRFHRSAVLWPGKIVGRNGSSDCVILNLSANGAKIRCERMPDPDHGLTLLIDRFGSFDADIVWWTDREAGLRFSIDAKIVAHVLGDALPSIRPDE